MLKAIAFPGAPNLPTFAAIDAAILPEGMATVLALRSRDRRPRKVLADHARYLELGAYQEILAERR